jgi:hypothetical protein
MVAAGVVPITWAAVLGEWQRDWAREKTTAGVAGILAEHGGGSGVAFAWEMQLLAGRAGAGMWPRRTGHPSTWGARRFASAIACPWPAHSQGMASPRDLLTKSGETMWTGPAASELAIDWRTPLGQKLSGILNYQWRQAKRQARGVSSRFELGDQALLETLREMSDTTPVTLKIFVVQPGVSRAAITEPQLRLLSVTENYLLKHTGGRSLPSWARRRWLVTNSADVNVGSTNSFRVSPVDIVAASDLWIARPWS